MVVESTGSGKSLTVVQLHQNDYHEGCSKRMFYIIFILIKPFIQPPYSGCVHIYYITAIFYWDVLSHLPTEEKNYTAMECSLKLMCALVYISGIILAELSVKQEERLLRLNEVDKVVRRKKNRGKIRNKKKVTRGRGSKEGNSRSTLTHSFPFSSRPVNALLWGKTPLQVFLSSLCSYGVVSSQGRGKMAYIASTDTQCPSSCNVRGPGWLMRPILEFVMSALTRHK